MKLVTNKFKSGGLHEKHVVATWNLGNHLSVCFYAQRNQEKPVSRWPVAGPSEYWLPASSPASKVASYKNLYLVRGYENAYTTILNPRPEHGSSNSFKYYNPPATILTKTRKTTNWTTPMVKSLKTCTLLIFPEGKTKHVFKYSESAANTDLSSFPESALTNGVCTVPSKMAPPSPASNRNLSQQIAVHTVRDS